MKETEMALATPEIVSAGVTNVTGNLSPAENRHLKAMEGRIERGLHTFRVVGEALTDIRDNRLYRETHDTFEAYCRDRWDLDRVRAYQLMGAAEVLRVLGGDEKEGPANESQAREMLTLVHVAGPETVKEVWKEVKASGKPITAQVVRQVVQTRLPAGPRETPLTATEALINRLDATAAAYGRWLASKPTRREKNAVSAAVARMATAMGATAG